MDRVMDAALMTGLQEISLQKLPVPEIKENEVLIKIEYVGICGSDLHYYEQGRIGDMKVEFPFVLGHEAAGVIVSVGQKVKGLRSGQRVALEPGRTCGQCEFCKSGKYNLCREVRFFATPPVHGTFQQYVAHDASLCFPLPEQMTALEGALIEPLAVGLHAASQGGACLGRTAVVMGAGCIGLVTVLALRAMGVSKIIVVDMLAKRLEKAREIGADYIVDAAKEKVLQRLFILTEGSGFDMGIDTAGSQVTMTQLIKGAKKGASIVFVGYSKEDTVSLPMNQALDKELTFKTVFRYRNLYPKAIEAVASGKIKVKDLVTKEFAFKDIREAMEQSLRQKEEIVKAVVKM